jgi:hypothetical protein
MSTNSTVSVTLLALSLKRARRLRRPFADRQEGPQQNAV